MSKQIAETKMAAVHNIRISVDGIAREIGRRVAAESLECADKAGTLSATPPLHDFGFAIVERHARSVLLDYLLGDFNPTENAR